MAEALIIVDFQNDFTPPSGALAVADGDQSHGHSALKSEELRQLLREQGMTAVAIAGLATDYCVQNTARDALGAVVPDLGPASTTDNH